MAGTSDHTVGFRPHILVSFMAYAMHKVMQRWMEGCGLGRGVRTVLQEVARLKCSDVILPTCLPPHRQAVNGREIHLQCVTLPDASTRALLGRLKLVIPQRLGSPKWRELPEK